MLIRREEPRDLDAITMLAAELGYPTTADTMRMRLASLRGRDDQIVLVAEIGERVVGWIHVALVLSLESEPFAEIRGLVVESSQRGSGIGAQLVAEGERWARELGLQRVRVRSNVARERTQKFYLRLDYEIRKTQNVFDKVLT